MAFAWHPELSEKQYRSLINSEARLNIWEGSVRSSKTIMSIVRWIEFIKTAPPGKLLMIGKTERTLKRNILDVIHEMVGTKNYRLKIGSGEVVIYGRTIDLVGANDERSEGKIRGMTVTGAYGDELTLWPESFFKMLLSRLSVKGAKFFGTTNPDSPYHWLKTGYIEKQDELDITCWHFSIDDNPALDPDYVASLKKEYTGLWYKRFILGLWVLAEGAVYDMFNEDIHSIDEVPKDVTIVRRWISSDYGTTNPCVFLKIGEDGEGNRYALDEYYWSSKEKGYQKTDSQYADDLIAFIGEDTIERIFVDPSAASFITELKQRELPVWEANNDVLDGIRTVATALSNGLLYVLKTCKNLLREFASYVWDPKSQKLGVDKPVKEYDHALDALRYFIYTISKAPIFDVW